MAADDADWQVIGVARKWKWVQRKEYRMHSTAPKLIYCWHDSFVLFMHLGLFMGVILLLCNEE